MKNFYRAALIIILAGILNGCGALRADYFPLNLNYSWTYLMNGMSKFSYRINRTEMVNDKKCFVVESYLGNDIVSNREDYYAATPTGILLCKSVALGEEAVFDPPQPVLMLPLKIGDKWQWNGKYKKLSMNFSYEVKSREVIHMLGRDFDTFKILIAAKSSEGKKYEIQRWYANHVGMLREVSTTTKGLQSVQSLSELLDYDFK